MDACSLLIASALALMPVQNAHSRSIDFIDQQSQVTERVLNRSICKDIDRVQDVDQLAFPVFNDAQKEIALRVRDERRLRSRATMEIHCSHSPRITKNQAEECNLTTARRK